MSKRNIWKGLGLAAVVTLALGFFCGGGRAVALSADEIKSIKSKAALEGVYQCFLGDAYSADWLTSDWQSGFFEDDLEGTVKLPYGLTDASDNQSNCEEIMTGFTVQNARDDDDLNKGLIPASIKNTTDSGKIVEFFAGKNEYNDNGMGYIASEAGNVDVGQDAQQMFISVDPGRMANCLTNDGLPDRAEFKLKGEYIGSKLIFPRITKNNDGSWFLGDTYSASDGINVPDPGSNDIRQYSICGITFTIMDGGDKSNVNYEMQIGDISYYIQPRGGNYDSYNDHPYSLTRDYAIPYNPDTGTGGTEGQVTVGLKASVENSKVDTSDIGTFDDWRLQWPTTGANLMRPVKWLNDNNNIGYNVSGLDSFNYMKIGLDESETYDLYKYYVKDVYNVPVICDGEENYDLYNDSNSKIINWKEGTTCRAFTSYQQANMNPKNVYGVDVNLNNVMWPAHFTKEINSFDEVLAVLGKINLGRVDASEGGTIGALPGTQDPGSGSGSQDTDVCYEGAGVLGWIVCPITSGLTSVGESLYKWVEEDFLQVRASIFTDSKNGVEEVWGTVRNIANIGFIIMFLIVVVSQVTGYGIDNYGIKRILPKLIIGAIVMNLSYVICELMIDVSNIAGSGLKDLLTNMAPPLEMESAVNSSYSASMAQYVIVGGGAIAGGAAILLLSSGGMGLILMLLIALLTVVISLVVLFVTLVVRQAGIVICVIIAPIAVLCYLLPNMEKYSKKWLSLMKGLLLVYPLCGLMIGAGNLMGHVFGNLAVNNGDMQAGFALSAMVVTAIPYLFVPTLLKSSLAAMGNLGAKISGFGSKLRGGASRKIKGSNAMKNSRERAGEFRTRIRAGVDKDGNVKNVGRFGKAIRGGNRGMARARAQYLKNRDTRNREDSLMGVGFMAAQVAQEKKATADEIENEMTLLKSVTNDGANEAAVVAAFDDAMKNGNWNKARAAMRLAGRRKDTATNFAAATLLNDEKEYDQAALSKVAKEISEGEMSKNYRAGAPFAFEYASDLNKGTAKGADGGKAKNFADWMANKENLHNALQHHVTTGQELAGVQGKNLRQMADLISAGNMNDYDVKYLRKLSQEAIRTNKQNGTQLDLSKAEQIYRLAYGDAEYLDKMKADGIGELSRSGARASAAQVDNNNTAGAARADETFSTRTPQQPAINVSALGTDALLDIATNPNSSMDDATRTAAENEYYKRVAISATQRPQVAPSPDSGVPTELPPPNLPPEPPQPAPSQPSQPEPGNNA